MKDIIIQEMSRYSGISLKELMVKRGDHFRFPVYMTPAFMDTDIDSLDLSFRSSNCLKKAGYFTIGALVENINGREELLKIRNMGKKSVSEVMEKLFCYQFSLLNDDMKKKFVTRVVELNT